MRLVERSVKVSWLILEQYSNCILQGKARWSCSIWLKSISFTVASNVRQSQLKFKCIGFLNRELGYEFQNSYHDTATVTGEKYSIPNAQHIMAPLKKTTNNHLPFDK